MNTLKRLADYGQSYWLDNLTRAKIRSDELTRRIDQEGLRGITSNPAIFRKAITGGRDYDLQIEAGIRAQRSDAEIYEELVIADIQEACDILRPVFDRTRGEDGLVSLEVSPHLAHDTEGTITEVRRLHRRVNRDNLMLKIPATLAGLKAIEQCLYEGVNINITLLFSIDRYDLVAKAYMNAMERRLHENKPVADIVSVASFFISRIDTLVDQLLDHRRTAGSHSDLPRPGDLKGRAGIASAKLAYQHFKSLLETDRWQQLQAQGARVQRLLWGSTSVKNPAYPPTLYVDSLIGPSTVNTLPDDTARAFAEQGRLGETLESGLTEAHEAMAGLQMLGIDIAAVTEQLLNEGIQKFIDPFDATHAAIAERRRAFLNDHQRADLQTMARKLRRQVIRMTSAAGSGHATSCLSCADLVTALFFNKMRWDPADPSARNVDTFLLSKGHAAPILWAALSEAGAIEEDPLTLRRFDSSLEGHPTPTNPWIRAATGSLGQGLAIANGMALANRLDGLDAARIYCLLGDQECTEGSVWEAAAFAAMNQLDNLIALVDMNGLGQATRTASGHDTAVLAKRFAAFGWNTLEIDGHDMAAVLDALDQAAAQKGPSVILACTIKGKGVSFLEDAEGWHGKALDSGEMDRALHELGEADISLSVEPRRVGGDPRGEPVEWLPIDMDYAPEEAVSTREAYGTALEKLGARLPHIVALDGDVMNSTKTEGFARRFPERFFESYIAEQNMAGMAMGLSAMGKLPYAATFACFLTRAYDFIRMANHSRPEHLVFCGSHAGTSIGEDGPSQMGLEDIAMFRALPYATVLYPCDAVSAEKLTEQAAQHEGMIYLRTTRPKTPVIYANEESFPIGGSKVLRQSEEDAFTIVAAGITVHEALLAHANLLEQGVVTRVIDLYSVKPLDVETLTAAARETRGLIVVEDHWIDGGIGDAVAAAIGNLTPVHRLGISEEPRSGTKDELLERYGISHHRIEALNLELTRVA